MCALPEPIFYLREMKRNEINGSKNNNASRNIMSCWGNFFSLVRIVINGRRIESINLAAKVGKWIKVEYPILK